MRTTNPRLAKAVALTLGTACIAVAPGSLGTDRRLRQAGCDLQRRRGSRRYPVPRQQCRARSLDRAAPPVVRRRRPFRFRIRLRSAAREQHLVRQYPSPRGWYLGRRNRPLSVSRIGKPGRFRYRRGIHQRRQPARNHRGPGGRGRHRTELDTDFQYLRVLTAGPAAETRHPTRPSIWKPSISAT